MTNTQPDEVEDTPAPDPMTDALDQAVDELRRRADAYRATVNTPDAARQAVFDYAAARDWGLDEPVRHLDSHEEAIVRIACDLEPITPITLHSWLYSEARKAAQDQRAQAEGWNARGFGSRADGQPVDRWDPDFRAWYARQRGPGTSTHGARSPVQISHDRPNEVIDTMLRDMAQEAIANRPLVVRTTEFPQ